MARPSDNSLKYYNQDTVDDDNLQYVEAIHGLTGYAVVHKLWKHIYGSPTGYYCEWAVLHQHLFCKKNGINLGQLNDILETCFEKEVLIFDRKMYEQKNILTSKGIQKRWHKIVKECGRKHITICDEHLLIRLHTDNVPVTHQQLVVNDSGGVVSTPVIGGETTQSKVKESKVKESKGVGTTPAQDFKNFEKERFKQPDYQQVKDFFWSKTKDHWAADFSANQAQKYFNHREKLGWKTGGGAGIENWQADANCWILEDLENQLKQKNRAVPRENKPPERVAANPPPVRDEEEKNYGFVNAIYHEYSVGTMKEENLPVGTYDFLSERAMIAFSADEKNAARAACNNNSVKAKKKLLAKYFDDLKAEGAKNVFELKAV